MINSSISSWWLPERERLTKGVTWVMVVRGRPPNDHAVIGLARGMVEMFHLRAVAESRKFPSAPESRRAWPVCEPPWKESRKGSWVRVAGEFVQGEGPTRTLRFTGGSWLLKDTEGRSDQPCHNTSTTPELNVPVSVVAWTGADPVAWAQPQHAGDLPHRMTRPPGGATGRWVDGAGDGGLDGPPHGAQGWSDYPAPGEDPPQLVRRRWPHLVPPENEYAARPHSSRKPPLKSETEWHSRWQNTSSVTTETAEPPPHPPGLIGRKASSSPDKNPQMWHSREPAISKQRYPIHGRGQREVWEWMQPLLLRCYNVAAAVKTPANTGRERLGRNLDHHHKLGDCWHVVQVPEECQHGGRGRG